MKYSFSWLALKGACSSLVSEFNWDTTPLGAPNAWPASLRCAVPNLLSSPTPAFIAWGPTQTLLYNDAYAKILGAKHPGAMGSTYAEVWPEEATEAIPFFLRALEGETFEAQEATLNIERNGQREKVFFEFSLSPFYLDTGEIKGVQCTGVERTAEVLSKTRTKEQLRFFMDILNQAPSFMAVLRGPDYRYIYTNQAHDDLLGKDVVGMSIREAVPAVLANCLKSIYDKVGLTGQTIVERFQSIRTHGGERHVTVAFKPLVEDGQRTGVVVVGFDVTEAEEVQRGFRQTQARFEAFDAMPQLVFEAGVDGTSYVNSAYATFVGLPREDLLGAGWKKCIHPEDLAATARKWTNAVTGETNYEQQLRIRRFDGEYSWMLVRAPMVKNTDDSSPRWLGTCTDIHESKLTEDELATARRRMSGAMAAGDFALFTWDISSDRVQSDVNLAGLFGLPVEETQGATLNSFLRVVHPDDLARLQKDVQSALDGTKPFLSLFRVSRPAGGYRHIEARAITERDVEGRATWLSGVVVDVSEMIAIQEALKTADKRKDEFLAMLAHELRNPLAPIVSAAAMIPRTKDARQVVNMAEVITRQAAHLTGLVDDLLDVSRVSRGQVHLVRKNLPLSSILSDALEQINPAVTARRQVVKRVVPAQKIFVQGDQKRLVQVMVNLLENASKYTPEGGKISLTVRVTKTRATIKIDDSGIGMSPQLCDSAFELFVQGDRTAERSQGGLGLGLALVKTLVFLHGGTVFARSAGPGMGSTFSVELPRVKEETLAEPKRELNLTSGKGNILVVDDNEDAAGLMALMLEDAGFHVWTRSTPSQALELAQQFTLDVCLLDIGLPEYDGYTLARKLRSLPGLEATQFAAVSGYAQPSDIERSKVAGFNAHFAKPVDPAALLEWVVSCQQCKAG